MDYPHEGAALAKRLVLLAIATIAVMALAVVVAFVVAGWFVGGDDSPSAVDNTTARESSSTTTTSTTTTSSTTTSTSTTTTTTVPVEERVLTSLIGELSLERRVEQLVVVGGPGADLMTAIDDAVGTTCIGGVFVADRASNWAPAADRDAAVAGIAAISRAAADCAIRPLVATDAEPGTDVLRVPVAPLPQPAESVDAYRADADRAVADTEVQAVRFATDLAALGVHVNLGVVADVDVDDTHYMARRGRTFGDDPSTVAALTGALVAGHCEADVAATLKHFPNQGATLADPHATDSVSSTTPAQWGERGRLPYVDTPAPLVMTGHVRYDGVDEGRPASLSAAITTGWLRDDLGYDGVVITDDLQAMRGVTSADPTAAGRAAQALSAGADLLLFVNPAELESVVDGLVARATDDAAFATRVDESVDRVLRLKAGFGLVDGLDQSWFPLCDR